MDILVIKSKTGEICIEKIQPTYNKFETSIDPIIPILNEHTSLKLYKVGRLDVCIEPPDGHGGGDIWKTVEGSSINQINQLKRDYSFDEKNDYKNRWLLDDLKRCTDNSYAYILPVKNPETSLLDLRIIGSCANLRDNSYIGTLLHYVQSLGVQCNVFKNIENYTIAKIENTDLLKEVDFSELLKLMPKTSLKDACRHIPLSEVSPIMDIMKLNENSTKPHIKELDTKVASPQAFNSLSLVEQYNNLKSQSNADGSVLLMQCGKFYNAFGSDAEKISDVTKVKLISRKPENIPMIGIPVDKFEIKYKELLTNAGLNVIVSNVIDKHFNRQSSEYSSTSQSVLEPFSSSSFTHS